VNTADAQVLAFINGAFSWVADAFLIWRAVIWPITEFEFNKSAIQETTKTAIKTLIEAKQENGVGLKDLILLVTGHTDERGSNEYNLALGQK
jgi:hypothetical protein